MAKVPKLAAAGFTKKQISKALGVAPATYWRARKSQQFVQFLNPIKLGEEKANLDIEQSTFNSARGFCFEESYVDQVFDPETKQLVIAGVRTVKRYQPPSTSAAALWLNNRSAKRWSRKPEESNKPAVVIFQFVAVGTDGKQEVIEWDPRKPPPIPLSE